MSSTYVGHIGSSPYDNAWNTVNEKGEGPAVFCERGRQQCLPPRGSKGFLNPEPMVCGAYLWLTLRIQGSK